MKPLSILFLLCLTGSAIASPAPQKSHAKPLQAVAVRPLSLPTGWTVFSQQRPEKNAIACANFSEHEWDVSSPQGKLKIQDGARFGVPSPDPLPFAIPEFEMGDRYFANLSDEEKALSQMIGVRTQIKVESGWIVGFNAGEFGGGLFWFSNDGKKHQRIPDVSRIVGLMKGPHGVMVISGIAHMTSDIGKTHRVEKNTQGKWVALEIKDLGSCPETFVQETTTTWLIVTNHALLRIFDSGRLEKLAQVDYLTLYPNSMVLDPTGDIYIGMRFFVTHMKKTEGEYKEEWLVLSECEKFALKDFKCICSAKP